MMFGLLSLCSLVSNLHQTHGALIQTHLMRDKRVPRSQLVNHEAQADDQFGSKDDTQRFEPSPIAGCEGFDCIKRYVNLPDDSYHWQDTGYRVEGNGSMYDTV